MRPDYLKLCISIAITDEIRQDPDSLGEIINNCSPATGLVEITKRSSRDTQQCCYSLENEGKVYGSYMASSMVSQKSSKATDLWVSDLVRQAAPEMLEVLELVVCGKASTEEVKKAIDKAKGLSIIKSHKDLTRDYKIIMPYKAAEVGSGKIHARLDKGKVKIRIVHDKIWYKSMSFKTFDSHLLDKSLEGALHR